MHYVIPEHQHHLRWTYTDNNANTEILANQIETNNLSLVFDAKDNDTSFSDLWKQEWDTTGIFVLSYGMKNISRPRKVGRFSFHTQPTQKIDHRNKYSKLRTTIKFVLRKDQLENFTKNLNNSLRWIPPLPQLYACFVKLVILMDKRYISRLYQLSEQIIAIAVSSSGEKSSPTS